MTSIRASYTQSTSIQNNFPHSMRVLRSQLKRSFVVVGPASHQCVLSSRVHGRIRNQPKKIQDRSVRRISSSVGVAQRHTHTGMHSLAPLSEGFDSIITEQLTINLFVLSRLFRMCVCEPQTPFSLSEGVEFCGGTRTRINNQCMF